MQKEQILGGLLLLNFRRETPVTVYRGDLRQIDWGLQILERDRGSKVELTAT